MSALLLLGEGVTEEERRLLPRGGITEEERRLLPAWEGVIEEEMTTLQEIVTKEERLLLGTAEESVVLTGLIVEAVGEGGKWLVLVGLSLTNSCTRVSRRYMCKSIQN